MVRRQALISAMPEYVIGPKPSKNRPVILPCLMKSILDQKLADYFDLPVLQFEKESVLRVFVYKVKSEFQKIGMSGCLLC